MINQLSFEVVLARHLCLRLDRRVIYILASMQQSIKDLVKFIDSGITDNTLERAKEQIGVDNLRIVSIKLLGWLRSELLIIRGRPLNAKQNSRWFNDLKILVERTEGLYNLFSCSESSINFCCEVSKKERLSIHRYVFNNYKPPLRTK